MPTLSSGEMCLLEPLVPGCDTGDQIGEVWDLLGPPSLQELPFSLQYYFEFIAFKNIPTSKHQQNIKLPYFQNLHGFSSGCLHNVLNHYLVLFFKNGCRH